MRQYSYRVEYAAEEMAAHVRAGRTTLKAAQLAGDRNGLSGRERSDMLRVYQAMKG